MYLVWPFNRQTGQYCPSKYTFFLSESENIVPQCTFKLNRAPATAGTWHVKGRTLKVNTVLHF
jgi:hypothetical protein